MDFQQGLITTIHEYGVTGNLLKELNLIFNIIDQLKLNMKINL